MCALLGRTPAALAQDDGIAAPGDAVVTGFSGTVPPPDDPPLPEGTSPLDETFIDTDGASLTVFDVRTPGGPPDARLIDAPVKFEAPAGELGQVFGVAMDDATPANIYATATSAHGLRIVTPDADGDDRPERKTAGQRGAQWMDGQFGTANGGGPGAVWRIDGRTGEITLFAELDSGPAALGNIAYDPVHEQLYVSNLGTGMIHRLDMNGNERGAFDHGVAARPRLGMRAVPADPANTAGITDPSFDTEDTATWGFTDERRRVWGLAYHGGRLYYAVAYGLQIWSVGIHEDGGFAGDPQWELDIDPGPSDHPVSDIVFTRSGRMIVAQRGGIVAGYDYARHHEPHANRVLRFQRERPDDPETPSRWVAEEDEYAIGFPGDYRNAAGGVAIGYGYEQKPDGAYGFGACEGTLWTTGDALRDNPEHRERLEAGGPPAVHGLQGNHLQLLRPENEPPWESYFVDYDGAFGDPDKRGHAGDVAIVRDCGKPDLTLHKRAIPERCDTAGTCTFQVEVENTGDRPYEGPLTIRDTADGNAILADPPPGSGWSCTEEFPGTYACEHPPVSLAPGDATAFDITFQMPSEWERRIYKNCADLVTPGSGGDAHAYNNEACAYVPSAEPGDPHYNPDYDTPDLRLDKFNLDWNCDWLGNCPFVVRITNVGTQTYTGPLRIHDFSTTPGTTLSLYNPSPPWDCGVPGADAFDCTHPPVTLMPGEHREVVVWMNGPPLGLGHTHVRNCAWIEWGGASPDFNPGNEYACSEIPRYPPGHPHAQPRLKLTKQAPSDCFLKGTGEWKCSFFVRVTNVGAAPYFGPFEFEDETALLLPPAAREVDYVNPAPWACDPGVGTTGLQTCTRQKIPGGLLPGETTGMVIGFLLPSTTPTPNMLRNCATMHHDNDGDGAPETLESCADLLVCEAGTADCPEDLGIVKFAPVGACYPGDDCEFHVGIKNLGSLPAAPTPDTIIVDTPDPDAGALTTTPGPPDLNCTPAGDTHECAWSGPILAGDTQGYTFSIFVPPDYPATTLENCVELPSTPVDFNDKACAIAFVPGPDLTPWSPSECRRGEDCALHVEIRNAGQRPFKGDAGLEGTLSPAVTLKDIASETPGLSCEVTGEGAYACEGSGLNIAPKGALMLNFTAEIPGDFPHDEITHTKAMLWPDEDDEDRNPENDEHTSTIDIVGPEEPDETRPEEPEEPQEPEEPEEPEGRADLALTKTANDDQCEAGEPCGFAVRVENAGDAPYSGPLSVSDTFSPGDADLVYGGPPPWSCSGSGGSYTCSHSNLSLGPGETTDFTLTFTPGSGGDGRNCAALAWGGAGQPRVLSVQKALNERGIDAGPEDGVMGPSTSGAIRAYQQRQGLPVTGRIDSGLLASLFGGGDANPQNDRDCASVGIEGEPQRRPCSGGRVRNNAGNCVCPSSRPQWTGQRCVERQPRECSGGRVRNNAGNCICPSSRPQWTGQRCVERQPRECSGGRVRDNRGQCVCPPNRPRWTGVACIPGPREQERPEQCSGGRVYDRQRERCECPPNRPVWNGEFCAESRTAPRPDRSRPEQCSGGRVRNNQGQCVCPPNRPQWTGQQCVSGQQRIPRRDQPRQQEPQMNLPNLLKEQLQ